MASEFQQENLILPAGSAGLRLDLALARVLPQFSRTRLQQYLRAGAVQIDGRVANVRERVQGGERVLLRAAAEVATADAPEAIPLRIMHEDESLLVIDKPAGLVVHPGAGVPSGTLLNALLAHAPELAALPRAGLVHRIDKDTTGLLVVARTADAHRQLVAQLAAHQVQRRYTAICRGHPPVSGVIDRPIGRHRSQRTRMAVRADGRPAITHYRVVERFRGHSLLSVELHTGRTHQIRVHLAHLGFPLVGDAVYGARRQAVALISAALRARLVAFPRQALHAERLSFVHPVSRRQRVFHAPLPADLRALLGALRADARRNEPRGN